MISTASPGLRGTADPVHAAADSTSACVVHLIHELAHLLPSQGPITVFVHHNTLHAYEHHGFAHAVIEAGHEYGCQPYLSEMEYRAALASGRITPADLQRELHDTLADNGDELLGCLGTRHDLWMAMIEHPLLEGTEAEIRWFVGESDALYRFRKEVDPKRLQRSVHDVAKWWQADDLEIRLNKSPVASALSSLRQQFGSDFAAMSENDSHALALHMLWAICRYGASTTEVPARVSLTRPTRQESDDLVDAFLQRYSAAFLDQGLAEELLPQRHLGYWGAFVALYAHARLAEGWLQPLPAALRDISERQLEPSDIVREQLDQLGIDESRTTDFLRDELLKLGGWAGMLWQMETNAEWTLRPAPEGTLVEYVAVRLLLLRLAREHCRRQRAPLRSQPAAVSHPLNRAFLVFQVAQIRGWSATDLMSLRTAEWQQLLREIEAFDSLTRRRIYQHAYERHFRDATLDTLSLSALRQRDQQSSTPAYQVVCCIDDREESFRRHLEEVAADCQTFGLAGFFGVAMYYRGINEANFRPLCPVNVKPAHFITEEPAYSAVAASRRRAFARRALGHTARRVVQGSRSILGGLAAGIVGTVATAPLVLRVLMPRLAAQISRSMERVVRDGRTQLRLESGDEQSHDHRAYTVAEMADVVAGFLLNTGLARHMAPLVVVCGHGSSSLNNPHAAAYDCGACGGGRGGPNARAFSRMANDHRVRRLLADRGIVIPGNTSFVGAYHNTCDDSVTYYDLDDLPARCRHLLERAMSDIDEARKRNAHERCRRFESARLDLSPEAALRHVEGRAADLSQVRSECGHATNAICLVGRRAWSRDCYLDRRAFLTSYDPSVDDADRTILARLLAAVVPVCAGINLEYYFSRVDNGGYGCGTKLPHNITSMLGVMDGAGSDLRTGLPWQMVEIHEPMRILFVIETTPDAMLGIMARNRDIDTLVRNDWVQLTTINPATGEIHRFRDGEFYLRKQGDTEIATVSDSRKWYTGHREHRPTAFVERHVGAEQL